MYIFSLIFLAEKEGRNFYFSQNMQKSFQFNSLTGAILKTMTVSCSNPTKKGSCSLSISHKLKLLKLRACFELSDLSMNRTIRFHAFYANLSRERIHPQHMF